MKNLRHGSLAIYLVGGLLAILTAGCASTVNPPDSHPMAPNDIDHQMAAANTAYEKGDYREAASRYQGVLAQNPEHVGALYKMGVIEHKQDHVTESRNRFLKVIALDPTYRKAYYNLGAIYATPGPSNNTEKAAFFFKKYLALEPGSVYREKIERWLAIYDSPQKETTVTRKTPSVGKPVEIKGKDAPDDLKTWLKEQADQMGGTE